jgi:hypothetical protein
MEEYRTQAKDSKPLNRRFVHFIMRQLGSTELGAKGHEHRTCAQLASQIEVSHYELFERAYHWYHGCDFSNIDGDFRAYLLSGCDDVPYYVRQFAREWQPGLLSA